MYLYFCIYMKEKIKSFDFIKRLGKKVSFTEFFSFYIITDGKSFSLLEALVMLRIGLLLLPSECTFAKKPEFIKKSNTIKTELTSFLKIATILSKLKQFS